MGTDSLIIYPLLTSSLFYLGGMAKITSPIWSKYPKRLENFMTCSACSGFWYGVLVSYIFGNFFNWNFVQLSGQAWYTPIIVGLCAIVWTPIVAKVHISSLQDLQIGNEDT